MSISRSGSRAAVTCILAGCTTVANEPDPAPKLDETVFRCKVEPVLAKQCSYNACHGNAGTALRVYTPGKLRATPPKNIDEGIAVLTDAEHHANFESASGFAFQVPNVPDNLLLRKPLPQIDGGFAHLGGAIFTGNGDPQFIAIADWLSGKGGCP